MGFPANWNLGALAYVGDPKVSPPVASAFTKAVQNKANYSMNPPSPEEGRNSGAKALATAWEKLAVLKLSALIASQTSPKAKPIKKQGSAYKALYNSLKKLFAQIDPNDAKTGSQKYYDNTIKTEKLNYITQIKKETKLKPPAKTLFKIVFG